MMSFVYLQVQPKETDDEIEFMPPPESFSEGIYILVAGNTSFHLVYVTQLLQRNGKQFTAL